MTQAGCQISHSEDLVATEAAARTVSVQGDPNLFGGPKWAGYSPSGPDGSRGSYSSATDRRRAGFVCRTLFLALERLCPLTGRVCLARECAGALPEWVETV